jgi:hypothetical protein
MSACSRCGTVAKATDKFCNVCGTPLARTGASNAPPPQAGPQYAPTPQPGDVGGVGFAQTQAPPAQPGGGAGAIARCQMGHEIGAGASYCAQGHPIALDQMQFSNEPSYGGASHPGYGPAGGPGYGGPQGPTPGGYGSPQAAGPGGYGGQPVQGGFGAAPYVPPAPAQPGYPPAAAAAYGAAPGEPYGQTPSPQGGYGQAPQPAYAAAPQGGYGQAPQAGYGQAPQPGYAPAPQPGHAPAPQPGYVPGPQGGYGAAPAPLPNDTNREAHPPRILRGFLVAYDGNPSGDFWPLTGGRLVVGRLGAAEGIDLSMQAPTISSRHAAMVIDAASGSIVVEDTGSTNGTFVNDEHIGFNGRRELRDGDRLRFGGYTTIVKVIGRF